MTLPGVRVDDSTLPSVLVRHLEARLGRWPPTGSLDVVGCDLRSAPEWDGVIRPAIGVAGPGGAVLSVPPAHVAAVTALADRGTGALRGGLAAAVGRPRLGWKDRVFRWCVDPAPLPDAGHWLPADDPAVPGWLRVFGGEVLVATDGVGTHLAGVGLKRHDAFGVELAVVTTPAARGKGLGRRLVAQAARAVLDGGAVPTYAHAPDNHSSARVAESVGFHDHGWSLFGTGEGRAPLRERVRRLLRQN